MTRAAGHRDERTLFLHGGCEIRLGVHTAAGLDMNGRLSEVGEGGNVKRTE